MTFAGTLFARGLAQSVGIHRRVARLSNLDSRVRTRTYAAAADASSIEAPKAAMLVIGNEILSGSISDANTPWLAKMLYSQGVDLVRVEFIPDDVADITRSVLALKKRVGPRGVVFTSGGIGPTHDDVTYEAVAAAFDGCSLQLHQPTVERMRVHYTARGVELNEARLRMATLPTPSEVLFTEGLWVPLVNVEGVYVLPGIPRLFQAMVGAHKERFVGPLCNTRVLYTQLGEGDLAAPLSAIAQAHSTVSIGSYPNTQEGGGYKVKLQFVSRDAAAVQAAVDATRAALNVSEEPTADGAHGAGAA